MGWEQDGRKAAMYHHIAGLFDRILYFLEGLFAVKTLVADAVSWECRKLVDQEGAVHVTCAVWGRLSFYDPEKNLAFAPLILLY